MIYLGYSSFLDLYVSYFCLDVEGSLTKWKSVSVIPTPVFHGGSKEVLTGL